jgi:succinyl-CoA synthetase beta subunit
MLEHDALNLARKYGIRVPEYCLARNLEEVEQCYERLAGKVAVAKIVGRNVVHKSDIGGVILGLKSKNEMLDAFETIRKRYLQAGFEPDGFIGVLYMEMINSGIEAFIGAKWDKFFGPTIMWGSGGTLVELLKDISIRIVPLNECEAERMFEETRIASLIEGFRTVRGSKRKVIETLLKVSAMIIQEPILELDINPLIVKEDEVYAVDVRIIRCS